MDHLYIAQRQVSLAALALREHSRKASQHHRYRLLLIMKHDEQATEDLSLGSYLCSEWQYLRWKE